MGDRRVLLRTADGAVDHLLGTVERSAVRLGGDVDRDRPRRGHAAVAVGQAQRNGPAGFGVGQRVGIGQVLDQRLGRVGGGIGIEHDGQRLAVDPVGDDAADDHGARAVVVGDAVARHADLADAGAFVANSQLILGVDAGDVELVRVAVGRDVTHVQAAAVEVGGIRVHQTHSGVDELRRVVDQVFHVRDAGHQIDDLRRRLAREISRIADEPLEDAAVAGVVIAPPAHRKIAVRQGHHGRALVAAGAGAVELQLAVDPVAQCVVLLGEDAVTVAVVVPGHDEAAVGQGGDLRCVLPVVIGVVDAELVRGRRTIVVEQAGIDAVVGAVLAA